VRARRLRVDVVLVVERLEAAAEVAEHIDPVGPAVLRLLLGRLGRERLVLGVVDQSLLVQDVHDVGERRIFASERRRGERRGDQRQERCGAERARDRLHE
jgi:hypothetical protein